MRRATADYRFTDAMQHRQREAGFGPFAAAGALNGNSLDVIVISADEALIATLQQATAAEHTLWHAPSTDAAVDLLIGGHSGILIADMQVLGSDAPAALERLQLQFPELVLLATGRRDEEGRIAGLISKGCVYRFLHKPVSPARANLFLATATRRYHDLAKTSSPALASVRQLTKPANRIPLIGGAIFALLAIVAAGWLLQRRGDPGSVAAVPATTAPEPATASDIDVAAVLVQARTDLAAGLLSAPPGNNALDHYRSVLAVEPDNAAALAGVEDVLEALEERVTQALQERKAPAAVQALAMLQKAQPDHPQLASLNAQLLALSRSVRPEPAAAIRQAAPAGATAGHTDETARAPGNTHLARARIDAGHLVEPEGDSALFYLRAAREAGEDDTANRILATDVGSRLLALTREAIAAGNVPVAQNLFTAATDVDREFELGLPELADVGRELNEMNSPDAPAAVAEQLAALLAQAIKLRESGLLIEPARQNAFEQLQQLADQFPDAPEVRTEQQRLASALVDHGRTALARGDLERAELLSNRADELVPRLSATRSLREQITAAKDEREAATRIVQAGELKRTREVAANYPPEAERRGIEGWVDIEFTIAPSGITQDLVARDAEPKDVFEKSALEALSKWRFEPVVRNGQAVSQRAVLRIRFALK